MTLLPPQNAKRSLFIHNAISSHLHGLGYTPRELENLKLSLDSYRKCGTLAGFVVKTCGCGSFPVKMTYNCNLRVCPVCSNVRKRRILGLYLPFFKRYPVTKSNFFQFLTISPPNYKDLREGFIHIKKSLIRFFRRKYIKDRVKAGFYVLEVKNVGKGWNIHIHLVIYGSWLDYRLRGRCNVCNQNLLKYNKISNNFYCANRKCGSSDVVRFKDTKLNREWKDSSGSSAHIYGERVKQNYGAISYLTKYISVDKSNFSDDLDLFEYICFIHKKKLINSFGEFYNFKKVKLRRVCVFCNEEINYSFDLEISSMLMLGLLKPPDKRGYF